MRMAVISPRMTRPYTVLHDPIMKDARGQATPKILVSKLNKYVKTILSETSLEENLIEKVADKLSKSREIVIKKKGKKPPQPLLAERINRLPQSNQVPSTSTTMLQLQRQHTFESQISSHKNGSQSTEHQKSQIKHVLQKVQKMLQKKLDHGNYKINVNQLETALSDAIGDDINSLETPKTKKDRERVEPFLEMDTLQEESKSESMYLKSNFKRFSASTASNQKSSPIKNFSDRSQGEKAQSQNLEENNSLVNETIMEVKDLDVKLLSKFKQKRSSILGFGVLKPKDFSEVNPDQNDFLECIQLVKDQGTKDLKRQQIHNYNNNLLTPSIKKQATTSKSIEEVQNDISPKQFRINLTKLEHLDKVHLEIPDSYESLSFYKKDCSPLKYDKDSILSTMIRTDMGELHIKKDKIIEINEEEPYAGFEDTPETSHNHKWEDEVDDFLLGGTEDKFETNMKEILPKTTHALRFDSMPPQKINTLSPSILSKARASQGSIFKTQLSPITRKSLSKHGSTIQRNSTLMNLSRSSTVIFQLKTVRSITSFSGLQVLSKGELCQEEAKIMVDHEKEKEEEKLIKIETSTKAYLERFKKTGLLVDDQAYADSILNFVWKQRSNKKYFAFAKGETIEKVQGGDYKSLNHQLFIHGLDQKYTVYSSYAHLKQIWQYYEQELQRLDEVCRESSSPYLDYNLFMYYFGQTVHDFYCYHEDDSQRNSFRGRQHIIKHLNPVLLNLLNKTTFNQRYEDLMAQYDVHSQFVAKENAYRVNKVVKILGKRKARLGIEINPYHRDIFSKPSNKASEIVTMLFQTKINKILHMLYEYDLDNELLLNIERILRYARASFYYIETSFPQRTYSEALAILYNAFPGKKDYVDVVPDNLVKCKRKNQLRKRKSLVEFNKLKKAEDLDSSILKVDIHHKLENLIIYKYQKVTRKKILRPFYHHSEQRLTIQDKPQHKLSGVGIKRFTEDRRGTFLYSALLGQPLLKRQQKSDQEARTEEYKIEVEEVISKQFGYKCILKRSSCKQYFFEVYIPVQLSTLKDMLQRGFERLQKKTQVNKDEFGTDSSMRDHSFNDDNEFDPQIQKQFVQKFMQKQRRPQRQHNIITSLFEETSKTVGQSKKFRHHQHTTIGTYYKNLSKKNNCRTQEVDNQAAEVVSGEEFQNEDEENFYNKIQNNMQIMQILHDVGGSKSARRSSSRKRLKLSLSQNGEESLINASSFEMQSSDEEKKSIRKSVKLPYMRTNTRLKLMPGQSKEDNSLLSVGNNLARLNSSAIRLKRFDSSAYKYYPGDVQNRTVFVREQQQIEDSLKDVVIQQQAVLLKYLLSRFHLSLDKSRDDDGNTLLLIACRIGATEIVKILLDFGVNPDIQNNEGNTALHYALSLGFTKIADLLLAGNASEHIENVYGRTPWEFNR